MYDDFDDYFYPAEDDFHQQMLMEEMQTSLYGDDLEEDRDDDLEKLLDELEYPFWTITTQE